MTGTADPGLAGLHRDVTETLLRLRLARCQRNRTQAQECEDKLNRLLDRLGQAYASVKVER